MSTGFQNNFACGEISEEAWDRTDIQPIQKGCEEATNMVVRIAGPLRKRRGTWRLGAVKDQTKQGKLIPFRRSIDDALMLEFGDLVFRVWDSEGDLVTSGGPVLEVVSPYSEAQLDGLRPKQVGDVIYLLHRDGLKPRSLSRTSNTVWTFADLTFKNGPWRTENAVDAKKITIHCHVGGDSETDQNPNNSGTGSIKVGAVIDLTFAAGTGIFNAGMVGTSFRIRESTGSPGVDSWAPGTAYHIGRYALSNGKVYKIPPGVLSETSGTTPPVHDDGTVSDGRTLWTYLHDGAGIVKITAVADADHATGTVLSTLPIKDAAVTSFWAESAYSDYRGWPSCWPTLREERMAMGGTTTDLDQLDITGTAGFTPTTMDFRPGTGTGKVLDIDAVRRRLGDDGAKLVWLMTSTFLIGGTESAEYLIAGSVLDQPISPAGVVVKRKSEFGSAEVLPVRAHDGVLFVAQGGCTLREMRIGEDQSIAPRDLTVLADHIAKRQFAELAWIRQPDNTLWARLGDGGLAAYVYHQEQQVEGWTRQLVAGGFVVESIASIPGPGKFETLWAIVSRTKDAATQRFVLYQSAEADALFYDLAEFYQGAPVDTVAGLDHFEGETVRVMGDGAELPDQVVAGGTVTLPTPASVITVGLAYKARFKSLRLDLAGPGTTIATRQAVKSAMITVKTALCWAGQDGGKLEKHLPRSRDDVPAAQAVRESWQVTISGDTSRDPRVVIEDDTGYDFLVYSIRPQAIANA